MDEMLERKKARMAESRARMDGMLKEHEEAMAQRLADVIDTAMEDTETMTVGEFRKRLSETE